MTKYSWSATLQDGTLICLQQTTTTRGLLLIWSCHSLNKALQQPKRSRIQPSPPWSSYLSSVLSGHSLLTLPPPNFFPITRSPLYKVLAIPWRTMLFYTSVISKHLSSQPLMLSLSLLVKSHFFQWKPFLTHSMTCLCPPVFLSLSLMEVSWLQNSRHFRKTVTRFPGICEHS